MRILLAHNYYGSAAPSGENQVFEAEREMLQKHGHEISTFTRHSDQIRTKGVMGTLQGALATPWNPWAAADIRRVVKSFQPDVVHVHNTFPLISPGIFTACGTETVRILTLHNYRLFCPAAIPMRNGHICTDCLDGHTIIPSLFHSCYRNSRISTVPLAVSVLLHRTIGTWTRHVNAFISLTDFQAKQLIKAGLPAERIYLKPNFYQGESTSAPWQEREDYAVFAGRLTPEKGVETLVRAWALWGNAPELRIVGDGPLLNKLKSSSNSSVRFLGKLSNFDTQAQIAKAKLLIFPSECLETFGMVIVEAFALGTPVATTNIGPLPSIVRQNENGLVFSPRNPQSLLNAVRSAWMEDGKLEQLALGAYNSYKAQYTEEANYRMLIKIYEQAIDASRRK